MLDCQMLVTLTQYIFMTKVTVIAVQVLVYHFAYGHSKMPSLMVTFTQCELQHTWSGIGYVG